MHHWAARRTIGGTYLLGVGLIVLAVGGCPSTGGTTGEDHQEETLSASIGMTPKTPATLEKVDFEVHIEDANGGHVMDMSAVDLQYRAEGSDDWQDISLTAAAEHFDGSHTFTSSGDYEFRVMGVRHGGHDMEQIHTMTMHVERAHKDAGPYHVEFESTPGHIHEEGETVLRCWVSFDYDGTAATGLTVQFVVEESDGHTTTLDATEVESGLYEAALTFEHHGEAHVEIKLSGAGVTAAEVDFHVDVDEAH